MPMFDFPLVKIILAILKAFEKYLFLCHLTIIPTLLVYLVVCLVITPRLLGLKGINSILGSMRAMLGWL